MSRRVCQLRDKSESMSVPIEGQKNKFRKCKVGFENNGLKLTLGTPK